MQFKFLPELKWKHLYLKTKVDEENPKLFLDSGKKLH